jgi:hypothetical protein
MNTSKQWNTTIIVKDILREHLAPSWVLLLMIKCDLAENNKMRALQTFKNQLSKGFVHKEEAR